MPQTATHLHPFDLALVAAYLIGITLFGLRFREKKSAAKGERSLRTYFLANNTIPWWAIALSIVSAETSTLTIISIPGVAFAGDFGFLQVVLGYMLGRIVVALLFLPRYFAGEMLTAYQLIDNRFGSGLHKVTAGLFLLTRAAAEGVRIFAVSIVVGIAIGTGDVLSIAIISALTLLYTFEGGMAAVIWTDVVQMAIYIGGTVVAILTLGSHVPGGWSSIHTVASAAGKFHMLNFALNLTTAYTFWAGVLGGTFLTMASHGTDQLMVQRMLAARNLRESRLALLSSGVVIFIQFALFLLIGVGLYVFYGAGNTTGGPFIALSHRAMSGVAQLPQGTTPDRIFPTFIVHEMPIGIAGLLVAAILAAAMSNLSAALNSLSSTTVVDFYMHLRPHADARERTLISKSSTVLWALVLFAIAVYSVGVGGKGHVVEIGLSIASVAYGCLLGVFLLGTLTKYATQTGTAIGMICGFALNLWLWQGTFPVYLGFHHQFLLCRVDFACPPPSFVGLTIPHIAWTWYVLIGAFITFAIGSLASLVFRKQSRHAPVIVATILCAVILSGASRFCDAQSKDPETANVTQTALTISTTTPDFTPIDTLITDAIAAHKLPGAVVLIGHNGAIAYEHAYGVRKLAGEPGLDGKPSTAEPMTEDTIFDMASLTKCLATATAVMQLYEAGKITSFDDSVEKYLPAFNAIHDPARAKVTLRDLLTHYSGEPADVNLKDPWGLAAPDKAEGIRRALTTPLQSAPGVTFRYSDINFILLGAVVEKLSGEREDEYTRNRIFLPLGMTETSFHPFYSTCSRHDVSAEAYGAKAFVPLNCLEQSLSSDFVRELNETCNCAPTAHDNEGTAATNPDFDRLLRGTVHDPTTRRMGGVAGHAGVFSTAHDMSLFASALLDKLLHNTGPFPLKQSTLQLMTTPEQPGHTTADLANKPSDQYPSRPNHDVRGFGWDIDSAFSRPRGTIFPIGSFGHTGFTGTSLWMDPGSDTYIILLANAIHPRGNPPISHLRGDVANAAAKALNLYAPATAANPPDAVILSETNGKDPCNGPSPASPQPCHPERSYPRLLRVVQSKDPEGPDPTTTARTLSSNPPQRLKPRLLSAAYGGAEAPPLRNDTSSASPLQALKGTGFSPSVALSEAAGALAPEGKTLTGIDVLESTHFAVLRGAASLHKGQLLLGLLTNQTGLDSQGHRTIDILSSLTTNGIHLTTVFSPEHGIFGAQDSTHLTAETDPATGLHVTSLYGGHDADRRPSHEQLKDLDAVVIDLQDAGAPFFTYETVTGYFLEAAAHERNDFHHDLEIIVLDRPNPIGGEQVQGPVSDPGLESYTHYMPLPIRHGMTLGELAQYMNGEATATSAPSLGPHIHATHTPPIQVDASGVEHRLPAPPTPPPAKGLGAHLTVIPMQHWTRSEYFDDTGLPWTNPSPNLRSLTANTLYTGVALLEMTNVSVGRGIVRGTATPFEVFGASWLNAAEVAAALNARHIPGVSFSATTITITDDANHYPFHGQTIDAVHLTLTDRNALNAPELGIEILSVLHRLYPNEFQLAKASTLIANRSTMDALNRGDDPRTITASWQSALDNFKARRMPYLLYK